MEMKNRKLAAEIAEERMSMIAPLLSQNMDSRRVEQLPVHTGLLQQQKPCRTKRTPLRELTQPTGLSSWYFPPFLGTVDTC